MDELYLPQRPASPRSAGLSSQASTRASRSSQAGASAPAPRGAFAATAGIAASRTPATISDAVKPFLGSRNIPSPFRPGSGFRPTLAEEPRTRPGAPSVPFLSLSGSISHPLRNATRTPGAVPAPAAGVAHPDHGHGPTQFQTLSPQGGSLSPRGSVWSRIR